MSPVPSATREQPDGRSVPILPYPTLDMILGAAKEIVVDWQLPPDMERRS